MGRVGGVTTLTACIFKSTALELAGRDEALGRIVDEHGLPEFWAREPGYRTLLLLILEQQVSLASAAAALGRLEARVGTVTPEAVLGSSAEELRADGFSRQKTRYAWLVAEAVISGAVDLDGLGALPDDEVRTTLTGLTGIGPWTAEVYLLSALRRPDTWPVGDIALQEAARRLLGLEHRPSPAELEEIGERWRPARATAARLLWHLYLSERVR